MTLLKVRRGFLDIVISFLKTHLPNRTKRLVFLASLTARLKNSDFFDAETLKKLNLVMALASNDAAIELPVCLNKVIWHDQSACKILSINNVCCESQNKIEIETSNIKSMAASVMSVMPDWLSYGERKDIQNDVEQLLSNFDNIVTL